MKTLSLTQPWASLIVLGAKRFETRSWQTSHRGPLAIHASKAYPHACKLLGYDEPFASALGVDANLLPTGAVLGVVELAGCAPTDAMHTGIIESVAADWDRDTEIAFGDYSHRRYAWRLRLLKRFDKPVPLRGSLGLWECPDGLLPEWEGAKPCG